MAMPGSRPSKFWRAERSLSRSARAIARAFRSSAAHAWSHGEDRAAPSPASPGLSASEGQYLVKILTGDLRIGLKEGLVEEAIANAFKVPLDDVKEANMLLGDIGRTASLASRKELPKRGALDFSAYQMDAGESGADGRSDLGTLCRSKEGTCRRNGRRQHDAPTFMWRTNSTGFARNFIATADA